ncbi:transcriptional regulator [Bordetella pertussis]|nr:transcriptional regulator [Bordetella pertussis]
MAQTQDALATLLGVSRHAVNRELRQLANQGLVGLGYGEIWVLTPFPSKAWPVQAHG